MLWKIRQNDKEDGTDWKRADPGGAERLENELLEGPYADAYNDYSWAIWTWQDLMEQENPKRSSMDLYRSTAGEIEARDAANRRGLDAGVRKNRLPNTGDERTVFVEGDGLRYSIGENMTEDERYEELQNVTIRLAEINEDAIGHIDLSEFNTRKKSAVTPAFKKLAKKLGIVNVDLHNSEIHFPFQFSNKNLEKSLHHQLEYGGTYQDYVKAMSCFEDVVANAALIEIHPDKKRDNKRKSRFDANLCNGRGLSRWRGHCAGAA